MAFVTAYAIMVAMPKYGLKDVSRLRRPVIRGNVVTNAAGADLAFGRVTRVAVVMGLKSDWYRLSRTGRFVAVSTSVGRPALARFVRGVVELHVKAFDKFNRKGLHRRRICLQIVMTDRAHHLVFICELIKVAADAGFVSRIIHL